MKRALFSLAVLFFPLFAIEIGNQPYYREYQMNGDQAEKLVKVGKRYVDLLNAIGAEQNMSHETDVFALCSAHCVKIVNGKTWWEGSDKFLPQLLETGKNVGIWVLKPLDILPAQDAVVLRFMVETEKVGKWITMVILYCNDEQQIVKIQEVFNAYEGE